MMRLTGVPVSAGIAIGPAAVIVGEELAIRDFRIPPERVEEEIAFFHRALDLSRRDLRQIRHGIAAELGESEAAIYDAHLMILDDPELLRAVDHGIREQRRNAGVVFRDHMSAVAARLESVENEYLRERHADVVDVERRVLRYLVGGGQRTVMLPATPSVLVAHDIGPSDVALLDRSRVLALVTEVGGRASHSAIVARGRGIPAVVAVKGAVPAVQAGETVALDGARGEVVIAPDEATLARFTSRRDRIAVERRQLMELREVPAATADGHRVELGANIELPAEVDQVLEAGADSVGLFRTEFFYLDRAELPSEEEQFRAYRAVTERLAPRPVLFRTMDLGGDKVASYLGTTHETNPFLGYRGIRLALHHPEMFRAQIRAIYRASAYGRARIMFPMISTVGELRSATAMCAEVADELERTGVPYDRNLEIGMMVETPSAVWMADLLAMESAFFSIGTNDLIQYTLAMDRDNERLGDLYQPLHPSILRSIRHTVECAHRAGRWVGVCGEMAGEPRHAVLLLGLGVDELSASPWDIPRIKAAIRSVTIAQARAIAGHALQLASMDEIEEHLRENLDPLLPAPEAEARNSHS
jgi:phosphotransferase system enzyme I (PtsI)